MKRPYPDDYSKVKQPLINNTLKCLVAAVVEGLVIGSFVYWMGL